MADDKADSTCSSENSFLEGAVGGLTPVPTDKMSETSAPQENQAATSGEGAAGAALLHIPAAKQEAPNAAGLERLLQAQRNEIMFELRRLQMGDRPVTGQGNREAVADFFTRALGPEDEHPHNPEDNRPESVTVEVNALVERRPVHAALHSTAFRRSLEMVLMGAVNQVRPARPRPGNARRAPAAAAAAAAGSSAQHGSQRPTPRPMRRRHAHPAAAAIAGHFARAPGRTPGQPEAVAEERHEDRHEDRPEGREHGRFIPPAPPAPMGPAFARQWVQQVPDPVPEVLEEERMMSTWESMEQAQREDLVNDITELVQRQLVTSVLTGNFRPVLERNLGERLQNTGTDGERVQQFIQSLPNPGIRRNDFSELGIGAVESSLSDEMSVISATAAVTVNAQSNTVVSRELRSLKSQMQELKSMMRLSFDLQLDIQRSVRQEVAAALKQTLASNASGSEATAAPGATASGVANTPVNDDNCLICLEGRCDSVLYQCGHMCVCYTCGLQLRARGSNCPVCRAPIRDIIRAYRSTQNNDD